MKRVEDSYNVRPPKGFGWCSGLTMEEIAAVRKKLGKNLVEIAAEINAGKLDETTLRGKRTHN